MERYSKLKKMSCTRRKRRRDTTQPAASGSRKKAHGTRLHDWIGGREGNSRRRSEVRRAAHRSEPAPSTKSHQGRAGARPSSTYIELTNIHAKRMYKQQCPTSLHSVLRFVFPTHRECSLPLSPNHPTAGNSPATWKKPWSRTHAEFGVGVAEAEVEEDCSDDQP